MWAVVILIHHSNYQSLFYTHKCLTVHIVHWRISPTPCLSLLCYSHVDKYESIRSPPVLEVGVKVSTAWLYITVVIMVIKLLNVIFVLCQYRCLVPPCFEEEDACCGG